MNSTEKELNIPEELIPRPLTQLSLIETEKEFDIIALGIFIKKVKVKPTDFPPGIETHGARAEILRKFITDDAHNFFLKDEPGHRVLVVTIPIY